MNSPRVTEAIRQAGEELMALSQEEFQARLDATKGSDLFHALGYAFDINYEIVNTEEVTMQQDSQTPRSQVPEASRWDLTDIYPDLDAWKADLALLEPMLLEQVSRKGAWLDDLASFKAMEDLDDRKRELVTKLGVYLHLCKDTDIEDVATDSLKGELTSLLERYAPQLAQLTTDALAKGEGAIMAYIDQDPGLEGLRFSYRCLFRQQEHVLSQAEEELLAGQFGGTSGHDVASTLNDLEIPRKTITLSTGEEVVIDTANYERLRGTTCAEDRRKVYEARWAGGREFKQVFATCFNGDIREQVSDSRVRKYTSCLEQSLFGDDLDPEVYRNLIKAAKANKHVVHRLINLRKRVLGIEGMKYSDLYVGIAGDPSPITWDEARHMVFRATAPMGDGYRAELGEGMADHSWVDVYPNLGKYSGAYSQGALRCHPYVLMNFNGDLESASTLAHEMGHAMHSWYANRAQHRANWNYSTFVAEIASTLNELLLAQHVVQDPRYPDKLKVEALDHLLEGLRTTFYRQTMFADFELRMYEAAEAGETLTHVWLCDTYKTLLEEYYGEVVEIDEVAQYEWTGIPHFFYDFYVWQYATSYMASTYILRKINEDPRFAQTYIDGVLKAGGSGFPLDILRGIGLDMSTTEPIEQALGYFDGLVTQLEELTK